ncbi:MFS transporter [Boudabousia liubingyangii]|uniref:Pseudouridine synthase n=1 Tax=Boudabousia liubingyangii TaxID=1921764 RepID=A0A1Q5PNY8_9ACTO|nr:pseudouridine synthase [Boudabousia liubingyangii]OKL47709.1 MFS transporter [Boudabousia liubingyangii]OKL49135.1 MFS transporter [Boudabousia liubingyangii]
MSNYDPHVPEGIRLQKVLAQAGVGSRRACEDLIARGKVQVNGRRVTELGTRVDPQTAIIHVRGKRVFLDDSHLTLVLNKPRGVVSTMSDPEGRPCLADFTADWDTRLFHVGRLDTDTEGLLLLTNDGELANRLTHPSWEVPKTYVATVAGQVARGLGRQLQSGVELEDGIVSVDGFTVKGIHGDESLVEIQLHSGKNRVVRRLMEAVGHPVKALVRTRFGTLQLGHMRPGTIKRLDGEPLAALMRMVEL